MKKIFTPSFVLSFTTVFIAVNLQAQVTINAGQSIQAAVNNNPPGTTFNIAAGTFSESIVPKSGDVFIGAGIGKTILDGKNSLAEGFEFLDNNNTVNGVTIKGMTVTSFTDGGIAGNGISGNGCNATPGWNVIGCEVSFCFLGIKPCGWVGGLISNNLIHDNTFNGIGEINCDNLFIDSNDIYHNNTGLNDPYTAIGGASDIKCNGGGPLTFSHNKIHDGFGCGLWFDGNCHDMTVSCNEIYNETFPGSVGYGVFVEIPMGQGGDTAPDVHIFNNYIHDVTAAGVALWDAGNAEVYNNAFANNAAVFAGSIFLLDEGDRGNGTNGLQQSYIQNNNIHDNWIANSKGATAAGGADGNFNHWKTQNNTFSHNTYYLSANGVNAFYDDGTSLSQAGWQALGSFTDSNSTFIYNGGILPDSVIPVCARSPQPSSNCSTIPAASKITDANGAVWTLTSGQQIARNGIVDPITANVILMMYYNDTVYQEINTHQWWYWSASKWTWIYLPGGAPPAATICPPKSNNCTTIPSASQIVDGSGTVWTVTNTKQIAKNGIVDPITANVILLLLYNDTIYQEITTHQWWLWSGSAWIYLPGGPPSAATACGLTTGINPTKQDNHIQISPNPAQDKIYFETSSPDVMQVTVNIFSIEGKLLITKNINPQTEKTLDVSSLSAGIYFVRFTNDRSCQIQKIIKQ